MRKKTEKKLTPILFDQYLWICLLEFLDENHELTGDGGKRLKDGVEYDWRETKNRNPIIEKEVWIYVVYSHLLYFTYN